VDCPDSDINNAAFVCMTTMIGGHDVVEEFLTCGMYPLLAGFSFKNVTTGMTAMSNVKVPLPVFPMEMILVESPDCFLSKVEIDAERILSSPGPRYMMHV
jgi:hypothetical protein